MSNVITNPPVKCEPKKRIDRSIASKVKAKLDIVDVINKTHPLRSDSGDLMAGATSTDSKSGISMKVNPVMQTYYDFAGKAGGGDVYNWFAFLNSCDYKRDFPKLLRIAADMAGIPIQNMTDEEIQQVRESSDVQDLLTECADIYHKNLTPKLRNYIHEKWGVSDEIIDQMKIGYAKVSSDDSNSNGLGELTFLALTGKLILKSFKKQVYFLMRRVDSTTFLEEG